MVQAEVTQEYGEELAKVREETITRIPKIEKGIPLLHLVIADYPVHFFSQVA